MKPRHIIQLLWVALVGANIYWLSGCEQAFVPAECGMVHWMMIGLLCFPASLALMLVAFVVGMLLDTTGLLTAEEPLSAWMIYLYAFVMMVLGYLQWFKTLPWIVERIKGRTRKTQAEIR